MSSDDDDEEKVIRSQLLVQGRMSSKISPASMEDDSIRHRLRAQPDEEEVDFNTGKPVRVWCPKCHKVLQVRNSETLV